MKTSKIKNKKNVGKDGMKPWFGEKNEWKLHRKREILKIKTLESKRKMRESFNEKPEL